MKKIVYLIFFSVMGSSLFSQDIHYSQFFNSPLNINPGLSGVFNGDTRISANYRSQWKSVPVSYQTVTGAIDFKINQYKRKAGHLNLGILFNNDKAGDIGLGAMHLGIVPSYTFRLGRKNTLTPGISARYTRRVYDPSAILSGNQWNGSSYDPSIGAEQFGFDNISYFDFGGGINLRHQTSYRTHIDLGVAYYHFTKPSQLFSDETTVISDLEPRIALTALTNFYISSRFDLSLNGMLQKQDPHTEVVLNGQGKIYLNKTNERSLALIVGAGIRLDDSWYPMIGLQAGPLNVSASYDFNFSDFDKATDSRGGIELAARYIFSKVPPADFKPCPIY